MTSIIKVDEIQNKAGTGPVTLTKQSAAKTFVQYDQGITTIGSSLNISSVSDNSTGNYTINFSSSYSSQNDRCCSACGISKGVSNVFIGGPNDTSTSSGLFESLSAAGTNYDSFTGMTIHGDLA
jgi:hypothetical protein